MAVTVSTTTMWRLTAVLSVVILVLRHDMVQGQGGEEAQIQRQKERLDMAAWIQANGGKVRQRSKQTKEHTKMALSLLYQCGLAACRPLWLITELYIIITTTRCADGMDGGYKFTRRSRGGGHTQLRAWRHHQCRATQHHL